MESKITRIIAVLQLKIVILVLWRAEVSGLVDIGWNSKLSEPWFSVNPTHPFGNDSERLRFAAISDFKGKFSLT